MARKKKSESNQQSIEQYEHKDKQRLNNPPARFPFLKRRRNPSVRPLNFTSTKRSVIIIDVIDIESLIIIRT